MAKNNEKRFVQTHDEGAILNHQIWVDKTTGVNYLFMHQGYAGGLTVLLDKDGKPVITPIEDLED